MQKRRSFELTLLILVTALTMPLSPASAGDLNVEAELSVPGTKLLVVELFATWCGPCMDAVPRWEALRRRYADKGLRFVVVSVKDDVEQCKNVPWRPDVLLCDEDGSIANEFGVDALPAAFLWTWQGNVLEERVHVEEVEQKIAGWMAKLPRVEVEVTGHSEHVGLEPDRLRGLIESELSRQGKLSVVVSQKERERLRSMTRASLGLGVDEVTACAIGQEVSPNSILEAKVTPGRDMQLRLGLISIESHCRTRDIAVAWDPEEPNRSVDRGVTALLARLKQPMPQLPNLTQRVASRDVPSPRSVAAVDPYEDALRRAEAAASAAKEDPANRLDRAWASVSKVVRTKAMPAEERVSVAVEFLEEFPDGNPYRDQVERFVRLLTVGADMVAVPAGRFVMGCDPRAERECDEDASPLRRMTLPKYLIDRTEVTVNEFAECVKAGACSTSGLTVPFWAGKEQPDGAPYCNWGKSDRGEHPINCLDWNEARKYCSWAKKRLPTEAEWEKAARTHSGSKYPWGNRGFRSPPVANIADSSFRRKHRGHSVARRYDDGFVATAPVGQFPHGSSVNGALDMIGNVWE